MGLGYRNLNASQTLLLGVNAFYDMTLNMTANAQALALKDWQNFYR